MQRDVTERTILAPLALILVAALLTLPIAVLLASRDVEHLAETRLGNMVGEMFSSHLDDAADDLARDILSGVSEAPAKTGVMVLDKDGQPAPGERPPPAADLAFATPLSRDLARAPSLDTYHGKLQWRGDHAYVAVAVRQPASDHILVGTAPLDLERLRQDFARRLQLDDFRFSRHGVATRDHIAVPVIWQDEADGSSISWKRENAGGALLRLLLPVVAPLMLVIAAGGFILLRRSRRLAQGVLAAHAQAEHSALHDSLTGLANRALFMQNLELALARHQRSALAVGVYMIDLDRFKQVNDSLGHLGGDDLIIETARRMQITCRAGDTVARFGGDEFAIVATAPNEAGLEALAERLVAVLKGDVIVRGGVATLSASVGMAIMGETGLSGVELLRRADLALYNAKHGGRARHSHFEALLEA
jgi:diguanylate cyclase (GGDEF)-like protein